MKTTPEHDQKIANMIFATVYPCYVQKIEKRGRTKEELREVIQWLTGFGEIEIQELIQQEVTFQEFFQKATLHPNAHLVT